jgi:xanthine dehydrogenase iron-sulfur cluster and FAD-binding subunit A
MLQPQASLRSFCRCTGFRLILDAGQSFACTKTCSRDVEELCPSNPASNPALPPCKPLLSWATNDCTWLVVHSLPQLYSILHDEMAGEYRIKHSSGVRLVAGNTSTGVYNPPKAELLIDIAQIPKLRSVTVGCEGIGFGGGVTIAELMKSLEENRSLSLTYGPLLLHFKRVSEPQAITLLYSSAQTGFRWQILRTASLVVSVDFVQ